MTFRSKYKAQLSKPNRPHWSKMWPSGTARSRPATWLQPPCPCPTPSIAELHLVASSPPPQRSHSAPAETSAAWSPETKWWAPSLPAPNRETQRWHQQLPKWGSGVLIPIEASRWNSVAQNSLQRAKIGSLSANTTVSFPARRKMMLPTFAFSFPFLSKWLLLRFSFDAAFSYVFAFLWVVFCVWD